MNMRTSASALSLALILAACREPPLTSGPTVSRPLAQVTEGTGLGLESVTGLALPLIGRVGEVVIDQAIIVNIQPVEDIVGQIVGLEARGVLQLTGGVLGTDVVTEEFATTATVTKSDPRCRLVTIDLGPIRVEALVASVDVPEASVEVDASGALGALLCATL